ncbi:MAG: response regulator [Gemmatimonadales bacterium]
MMTAPPRPPATVLIVDDEAGLRRVLERFLERHGYRVLSVGSAEAAYETLGSEEPAALLLDIHLPQMSGLALYLAIIHRWPALDGRIAIMTGDAEAEEVRTWLEHHHCTVLRKPFNLQQVADWVASVLHRDRSSGAMDA